MTTAGLHPRRPGEKGDSAEPSPPGIFDRSIEQLTVIVCDGNGAAPAGRGASR
jgi:hypothetical protein